MAGEEENDDPEDLFRASRRWERIHKAYLSVCSLIVLGGLLAFEVYREWVIWSR